MNNLHVAVIGAGATGVAAFIALVRHRACKRITLIDASGPGNGQVYANQHPEILCNTSVELMSLLPPEFEDLLCYLQNEQNTDSTLADFIPRKTIGEYIRHRYHEYLSLAHEQDISVTFVRDSGKCVVLQKNGEYLIHTTDGGRVVADAVIVCTGCGRPKIPASLKHYQGKTHFFTSPYPENLMLQHIRPGSDVLIMGTRLSAVDAALVLCRHGCRVKLVSPSGELPAVRSAVTYRPVQASRRSQLLVTNYTGDKVMQGIRKNVLQLLSVSSITPVREQFSFASDNIQRLREETELARHHKTEWQHIVVGLIELINQKFFTLPDTYKVALKAFIKESGRYISAMPLQNAEKLLDYASRGVFSCEKLHQFVLKKTHSGWIISGLQGGNEKFESLVCATGYKLPSYHVNTHSLTLTDSRELSDSEPHLTSGLQLQFAHSPTPEAIWLAGVSTHGAVPVVNALFVAVRQVNQIARAIGQL